MPGHRGHARLLAAEESPRPARLSSAWPPANVATCSAIRRSGHLDADKLLAASLESWREHGEALLGTATYPEIAPHLVRMAFLHRVESGAGVLNREYADLRGRIDLRVADGTHRRVPAPS